MAPCPATPCPRAAEPTAATASRAMRWRNAASARVAASSPSQRLEVWRLDAGSLAERIGMRVGDRVERFGSRDVSVLLDYLEAVREWAETGSFEIRIRRGGESRVLTA